MGKSIPEPLSFRDSKTLIKDQNHYEAKYILCPKQKEQQKALIKF